MVETLHAVAIHARPGGPVRVVAAQDEVVPVADQTAAVSSIAGKGLGRTRASSAATGLSQNTNLCTTLPICVLLIVPIGAGRPISMKTSQAVSSFRASSDDSRRIDTG